MRGDAATLPHISPAAPPSSQPGAFISQDLLSLKSQPSISQQPPATLEDTYVAVQGEAASAAVECPICFEDIDTTAASSLTCSNSHKICLPCSRFLVRDNGPCRNPTSCGCTGFWYKCPVCRVACDMSPSHVSLAIKGMAGDHHQERFRDEKVESSSLRFNNAGITEICVGCKSRGFRCKTIGNDGQMVALSCSDGHALCVDCSRKLVVVKGKCLSASCKGVSCKSAIHASYQCPECKKGALLNRHHFMVIIRGGWKNGTRPLDQA